MARRQQEKSFETYEELRESAVTLFETKGFNQTTIAEITKNAGYAKGNFYRYWKSKDDIFLTIMEERFKAYRHERKDALEKASKVEDVLAIVVNFLERILDDGNWAKVFLEFTIHASGNDDVRKEVRKGIYRLSSDLFAEMFEPFKVSDYPVNKIGALVSAMFEGFMIQNLLGINVVSKDDLMRAILTLIRHIGDQPVPG